MDKTIYKYEFGIDKIKLSETIVDNTMCFISKPINISDKNEKEKISIQLSANCDEGNGSIEFYIVDSSNEIPILPYNQVGVTNEKIFYNMPTRFSIDTGKPVVIKKDGNVIDISLEQAINLNKEGLTVDYTPVEDATTITINNTNVKVKVIFRAYDLNDTLPYLKSMSIRKIEGSLLWAKYLEKQ